MKLPRWVLACLIRLSLLSAIAVAGWWWVTWPYRTAHAFIDLVADCRWEESNKVMRPSSPNSPNARWIYEPDEAVILLLFDPGDAWSGAGWQLPPKDWQQWFQPPHIQWERRSIWDWCRGRTRFHTLEGVCVLTAERGRVSVSGYYAKNPLTYPAGLQVHSFPGRFLADEERAISQQTSKLDIPKLSPLR
jgi:hypothetical protein